VILLAALPGDIESEKAYSDQLQAGLKIVASAGQTAETFILCDNPEAVNLSAAPKQR